MCGMIGPRSTMGLLDNPRHEQFAQLVAAGHSPARAYAAAGYEEKTAYTCGPRLFKQPEVRSRVSELQQAVTSTSITCAALNREFVITELKDNALKAKQHQEWSASNRALELLGRELGMFVEHTFKLPQHPAEWPQEMRDAVIAELTRLVEAEEQKQLAGPVVDIHVTESSTTV